MYINQTSNEYHHLQVKWIDDYSNDLSRSYVRLKCTGKSMYRTVESRTGYRIYTYDVWLYVTGHLMDYVKAEIGMRDNIFVVGRSVMRKPNKYSTQRALVAECIYKEDWLNFYKAGGATNPQDYEDVYRELMEDYDE